MEKPYMKVIDVSMDETHYVPFMDLPHKTETQCSCQPEVVVGALGFKVEHRPYSSLTDEQ